MPSPTTWQIRGRELSLERPLVMGVVNVTPDSFSDGGRFQTSSAALAHAARLVAEGADIVDVGGESTRPQGAEVVPTDEELRRVLPVIQTLAAERPELVISVDTMKAAVAEAALAAGAHIVNDVSGLRLDAEMAHVCAAAGAGVVVMHSRGGVTDMATFAHADYDDFLAEMLAELAERVRTAERAGVPRAAIAVDPGIGFSKRTEHSLRALACLERLTPWGLPIVVGASRKRFIGQLTGQANAAQRVYGSVGAAVMAYERGAHVLRVHDVAATRQALDVAAAIRDAGADR
ncbi:MAG: dihydropteroate synthase [Gemmatimonadaceae bacterium]|nr:dihydropteroate synthase [Gemmatimonadaceae bacterium]NUP56817.1 dihydropteroate synthase [Gemmatimonadaceae bacterium]NUP71265.1 dihydropteroate synthase [Gemmatimonadaceae bacterium]NUS31618.1 dihydropteroate synthase [Gemmatimonadaceae bacterium]